MIVLNIAMAVLFFVIGAAVCYVAEEKEFDECIEYWIGLHQADIDQQWVAELDESGSLAPRCIIEVNVSKILAR